MPPAYEVLASDLVEARFIRERGGKASLSAKAWAATYKPIRSASLSLALTGTVLDRLGDPTDPTDHIRQNVNIVPLSPLSEVIEREADVDRDFYRHLTLPCLLAWKWFRPEDLNFIERSQSIPPDKTEETAFIDYQVSVDISGTEVCLCAGELKNWGVIVSENWSTGHMGGLSERLGKEIRG